MFDNEVAENGFFKSEGGRFGGGKAVGNALALSMVFPPPKYGGRLPPSDPKGVVLRQK